MEKYIDKSTGTADKYVHVSKTSFPVMTICPTYPYNINALNQFGIDVKTLLQFGAQWVPLNDSSVSPQDFYEKVLF